MPIKVDRPRLPFPTEPDHAKTGQNSLIELDRVDRIGGVNLALAPVSPNIRFKYYAICIFSCILQTSTSTPT